MLTGDNIRFNSRLVIELHLLSFNLTVITFCTDYSYIL